MTTERKPVDVLAVMLESATLAEANNDHDHVDEACEARAAVAELIEAVKTQRAIAAHVEPWKTADVRQGYAQLVGLGPFAARAEIEKRADENVRAALARVGGA